MLISFIFSYLESFFVVLYVSFYFILAQGASARAFWRLRDASLYVW